MRLIAKLRENYAWNRAVREGLRSHRLPLRKEWRQHWQLYLMSAPFLVLFFLLILLPIAAAVYLSFTDYNVFGRPEFSGFSNYIRLFSGDDVFYISVKNTFLFALITGPLGYVLCFFVAWLINECPKRIRSLLTLVFYSPTLASSAYFVWQFVFSGDSYGVVNSVLMRLGVIYEPIQWLSDARYSLGILMIVQLWMSLGTSFLAFIAGFKSVSPSLYEAADIDGIRNRYQELLYITLPIMKPQLLFSAIMQISASFSVSTISMQLCGFPSTKYSAHTIVLHILDYGNVKFEMGYACTIAVVLFVILLVIKALVDRLLSLLKSE
mgnify:CR=1 FL=1